MLAWVMSDFLGDTTMSTERLLLPIDSSRRSAGVVNYVIRRRDMGHGVEACLLHVEQPLGDWGLLRNMTRGNDAARRQVEQVLSQVAHPLVKHDIPYAAYLRSGSIVFSILDAAEELDCQQIVVPLPPSGLWRFLSGAVVSTLYARQRNIPVVAVDGNGLPVRSAMRT